MTGKINKWLLPFSILYGWITWLRNRLFDWRILPSEEFSIPVICVGNITVGGTGKTPHVEFLIRLLSEKYKVAVLSRGYKRKTRGFILADEKSTARSIGDEPYQIFRKFPQIIVAVDSNRRRGIKALLNLSEDKRPDIILLDDAFQHRYVRPSLSILLTDSHRLIYEDTLLPAGRLRESLQEKSRANIVIVTKCNPELKPIDYRVLAKNLDLYPYQTLFFTGLEYGNLIPYSKPEVSEGKSMEKIRDLSVFLIAGIADPGPFADKIKEYTSDVRTLFFPDHHAFSKSDLQKIETDFLEFEQMHPEKKNIIITTEKDFARLSESPYLSGKMKEICYYLPIEVVFKEDNELLFTQKIEKHVKYFKRDS